MSGGSPEPACGICMCLLCLQWSLTKATKTVCLYVKMSLNENRTRNDVYETLCPQPFACQELMPKFAKGNY